MVEAEFDKIADFYDTTRDPATESELKAVEGALRGSADVLEVGVGTGRFAKPLVELGFNVVGVDISRGMMAKALQKGVKDLVLADAHHLPFRDKSFDAAVAIHILHIVPDWRGYMRDVARVTKSTIVALLRTRDGPGQGPNWGELDSDEVRNLYAALRAEAGYPIDVDGLRRRVRMWMNEAEIRKEVPPAKTERIRDEVVTVTLEDALRRRRQMLGAGSNVPEDVEKRIIQKVIEARGNQSFRRAILEDLVVWRPEQFAPMETRSSS